MPTGTLSHPLLVYGTLWSAQQWRHAHAQLEAPQQTPYGGTLLESGWRGAIAGCGTGRVRLFRRLLGGTAASQQLPAAWQQLLSKRPTGSSAPPLACFPCRQNPSTAACCWRQITCAGTGPSLSTHDPIMEHLSNEGRLCVQCCRGLLLSSSIVTETPQSLMDQEAIEVRNTTGF